MKTTRLRELWYDECLLLYGGDACSAEPTDGTVGRNRRSARSLLGVRQNLAGAGTSGVERGGKAIERSAR